MALSVVEICSNALLKIGSTSITSLEDDSNPARLANRLYEPTRDALLREHPWNFAIRRSSLARLSDAPAFGYDYAYQLPADPYCLRVLAMSDEEAEFVIEGRELLTDETTAKIRYIALIDDPAQYDALFVQALEAALAAEMAIPIMQDVKVADAMMKLKEYKLARARAMDGMEGTPQQVKNTTLIDVRR